LSKHFGITAIPCYYWLLCLLKLIKPDSLNRCFIRWAQTFIPKGEAGVTISFDGKTVRSTGKMGSYDSPLHIISAQLAELGITLAQKAVEGKSNEIPAMRELLALMDIEGCMIVADALHCQKETAEAVIAGKGDYLLNVKDNQQTLKEQIAEYVQDGGLRKGMDSDKTCEKTSGRVEKRTAYATGDIGLYPYRCTQLSDVT
jgi:predicted transposase YbfD/YdcC